jgi:hypothetical protein
MFGIFQLTWFATRILIPLPPGQRQDVKSCCKPPALPAWLPAIAFAALFLYAGGVTWKSNEKFEASQPC